MWASCGPINSTNKPVYVHPNKHKKKERKKERRLQRHGDEEGHRCGDVVTICTAAAAAAHDELPDHRCGSAWPYCDGDRCCSKGGYCGEGAPYCCRYYCAYNCPDRPPPHCRPEAFLSSTNLHFSNITGHN
ncbi:unnamed protein product [Linum trigynum]|uniref:Chitin-binding type-1 domain-containing protein n=1 Tax=Linum trigynum TaxID=586398 RepID=A0AAV2DJZ6_9ROSI